MAAFRKVLAEEETRRAKVIDEAAKNLKAAQDGLRSICTVQQEAVLVVEDVLD